MAKCQATKRERPPKRAAKDGLTSQNVGGEVNSGVQKGAGLPSPRASSSIVAPAEHMKGGDEVESIGFPHAETRPLPHSSSVGHLLLHLLLLLVLLLHRRRHPEGPT
jgi:hypothetical protein